MPVKVARQPLSRTTRLEAQASLQPQATAGGHVTSIEVFTAPPHCEAVVLDPILTGKIKTGAFLPTFVSTTDVRIESLLETALATGFQIKLFGHTEIQLEPNGGELLLFIPAAAQLSNAK